MTFGWWVTIWAIGFFASIVVIAYKESRLVLDEPEAAAAMALMYWVAVTKERDNNPENENEP